MAVPPVPARLADRPTVGGLVVPWISVQHADGGAALGAVHGSRQDACVQDRLCQIDGELVAEPGLHPECVRPVLTPAETAMRSLLTGLGAAG